MFSFRPIPAFLLAGIVLSGVAGAQQAQPEPVGADTFYLQTKVGSFKLLGAGDNVPTGHFEINFTGTILLSGVNGKLTVEGKLHKEYENTKRQKVVYFGTGKVVVDGKLASAQWFGRDMTAMLKGFGVFRMYGEFDKNLDTGEFWYGNEPNKKQPWGTGGREVLVPQPARDRPLVPTIRNDGGG